MTFHPNQNRVRRPSGRDVPDSRRRGRDFCVDIFMQVVDEGGDAFISEACKSYNHEDVIRGICYAG